MLFPAPAPGQMAGGFLCTACAGFRLPCFWLPRLCLFLSEAGNRFIKRWRFFADGLHGFLDMPDDLPACNQACAFILPVSTFVFRAPEEVVAVEVLVDVIPAPHAPMGVVYPVGGLEFADGQCKTADEDDGHFTTPCEPCQPTAQSDEEIGMFYQLDAFLEWDVAGEVFSAMGDMVPDVAQPIGGVLVDAEDPVACLLEVPDDGLPAIAVVPVFALGGCLGGDADIGFFNLPFRAELELRYDFFGINPQDITCCPVQADFTEVDGLEGGVCLEEKPDAVGGVGCLVLEVLRGGEGDAGVLVFEEFDDQRPHCAFEPAAMLLTEAFGIGEPANEVAQCPDWIADEDVFPLEVHRMLEAGFRFTFFPDLEGKPDEVFLGGGNPATWAVTGEDDVAGFVVDDFGMPVTGWEQQPCPIVEVITDAVRSQLGRDIGWRDGIGTCQGVGFALGILRRRRGRIGLFGDLRFGNRLCRF